MKKDKEWEMGDWWDRRSSVEKVLVGVGLAVLGVGLVGLYGLLVQSLWNWLMPELFGWKPLDFWQALGLPTLIMLLFMGVGGGDKSSSGDRKRKRKLRQYVRTESAEVSGGQP